MRDSAGQPLPRVTVTALGRDASTITDIDGRFHIGGLPAGIHQFTAMRLGFTAVNFDATLSPDSTLVVDIRMRAAQQLPGVTVSGERVSPKLARDGFYDRQKGGLGKYLPPEEVEKLAPIVGSPAQLLRNVPGILVKCRTGGCSVQGSGGRCMNAFVDGVYSRVPLDVRLSTGMVYAVEVYNRDAIVPMEFQRTGRCGAVVVWTQSRKP